MLNDKLKRVFIIHGYGANPECNWFPWLKGELNKRGLIVQVPAMPNTEAPECRAWVSTLKGLIGQPDKDTILVGHSLGTAAILRYLESFKDGESVGDVFLVAGADANPGFPELDSFVATPPDYEKIKNSAKSFMVIHSDDDRVVPFEMGQRLAKGLGAEFVLLSGLKHLNAGQSDFAFPLLLEGVLKTVEK
jgi:predicted alpha/beta hydrolase family esterase